MSRKHAPTPSQILKYDLRLALLFPEEAHTDPRVDADSREELSDGFCVLFGTWSNGWRECVGFDLEEPELHGVRRIVA